jgi:hypothetical protein
MTYKEQVYAHVTLAQAERFWASVTICEHGETCQGCCWKWQGKVARDYGSYATKKSKERFYWRTHRFMWVLVVGEVPPGLFVLHRCDEPLCVNPAHLWLGTPGDNSRDMRQKLRSATGDRNGMRRHPERFRRWGHGLERPTGERNPRAKLTETDVRTIRALKGTRLMTDIAQQFDISLSQLNRIMTRRAWKHLPDEGVEESTP